MRPSALVLLLAAAPLGAQRAETYTVPGRAVAIYNLAGEVKIERGTGPAVTVEVTRQGRDANKVSVATGAMSGIETLRIVYDGDRIVYPKLTRGRGIDVQVRKDGRWGSSKMDGSNETSAWSFGLSWRDRTRISGTGSGIEAWADVVVRVPDGVKTTIHHAVGTLAMHGVRASVSIDLASADANVKDHVGDLMIDGGSGDVTLVDIEGALDLDLGSGRTELKQVKASTLRIDSGSGGVSGDQLSVSESLDLDAGSGRAILRKLSAKRAKMDLGSGGLEAEFLTNIDDLRIDSGSGSVTLYLPESVGAELDIDTGSGGISSDFPIVAKHTERGHLSGTLGDGKGRISVDAGSGTVRIRKLVPAR